MFHFAHTFRVLLLLLLLGPLFVHCAMGSPFMDDDDEAEADSDCLHTPPYSLLFFFFFSFCCCFTDRRRSSSQPISSPTDPTTDRF